MCVEPTDACYNYGQEEVCSLQQLYAEQLLDEEGGEMDTNDGSSAINLYCTESIIGLFIL